MHERDPVPGPAGGSPKISPTRRSNRSRGTARKSEATRTRRRCRRPPRSTDGVDPRQVGRRLLQRVDTAGARRASTLAARSGWPRSSALSPASCSTGAPRPRRLQRPGTDAVRGHQRRRRRALRGGRRGGGLPGGGGRLASRRLLRGRVGVRRGRRLGPGRGRGRRGTAAAGGDETEDDHQDREPPAHLHSSTLPAMVGAPDPAHRRPRHPCAAYDEPAAAGVDGGGGGGVSRRGRGGAARFVPAGPPTTWSKAPALAAGSRLASHVCAPVVTGQLHVPRGGVDGAGRPHGKEDEWGTSHVAHQAIDTVRASRVQHLPEPDDVRSQERATRAARERWRHGEGGVDRWRAHAAAAARPPQGPVDLHQADAPRPAGAAHRRSGSPRQEAVAEPRLQGHQGPVGVIRLRRRGVPAPGGVEAPDQLGVGGEALRRGDLLHGVPVPQPAGAAERRQAALRRDPGPRSGPGPACTRRWGSGRPRRLTHAPDKPSSASLSDGRVDRMCFTTV